MAFSALKCVYRSRVMIIDEYFETKVDEDDVEFVMYTDRFLDDTRTKWVFQVRANTEDALQFEARMRRESPGLKKWTFEIKILPETSDGIDDPERHAFVGSLDAGDSDEFTDWKPIDGDESSLTSPRNEAKFTMVVNVKLG